MTAAEREDEKDNGLAAGAAPIDPVQASPPALTAAPGRLPFHPSLTGGHLSRGGALRGIASDDGINVAWVSLGVLGAEERLAFIVRACNAHDGLVAALKIGREHVRFAAEESDDEGTEECKRELAQIDAALSLAEPSPSLTAPSSKPDTDTKGE